MSEKERYLQIIGKYGAHNYRPLPVLIERARGVWLIDSEGKKILDCVSTYSAISHGHRPWGLAWVAIRQMLRGAVGTPRLIPNRETALFFKELSELCDKHVAHAENKVLQVLPKNGGTESVEVAIKLVRRWGYEVKGIEPDKAEIIGFGDDEQSNFHGRSFAAVSLSTVKQYRRGFGPHLPGISVVPYGKIEALKKSINKNTAGVLIEPILGEGGIVVPPEGYLRAVRELCTENNVLMIADEIQTGLGRTGKLFACDHEGVRPDVLIIAKSLGGGLVPISATVASEDIFKLIGPGDDGSTFGGNPYACAIARKALRIIVDEDFAGRAASVGEYCMRGLKRIQKKSSYVKDVRGRGLLIGIELDRPAEPICKKLLKRGVFVKDTRERVIRFTPPLIINKKEADWGLDILEEVLTSKI